jgi:predicted nucleic acid-binding protein
MTSQPEITQRDLRLRSREIMDAVERGQAFTVTRDGRSIGELVPLRQRRRFVSRAEFAAMSRTASVIDQDAFRADQEVAAERAEERARRLDILQRAEHEFDPIPFDADAARAYGRVVAAVLAVGRKPGRRATDLMIAATAMAAGLPLYTANPDDFTGLDRLLDLVPVTRPVVPGERSAPGQ